MINSINLAKFVTYKYFFRIREYFCNFWYFMTSKKKCSNPKCPFIKLTYSTNR